MPSYRLQAINTAPDSENKIHDDAVAGQYGFRAGLVPGVTVYGYMIPLVLEHYGERWLEEGSITLRLNQPVYEGEDIEVESTPLPPDELQISVAAGRTIGLASVRDNLVTSLIPPGEPLKPLIKQLNLTDPAISAPHPAAIGPRRLAHPAVLLSLANEILMSNFQLGPWIHAQSQVQNLSSASDGETVTVNATIVETYQRKGHEFVVLHVTISSDDRPVQRIRHTAIWKPSFTKRTQEVS